MIHHPRRVVTSAASLVLAAAAVPTPVGAHALHGEVDAPLPFVAYAAGAAAAVALSFVFAAIADDGAPAAPTPGRVRRVWRPFRWLLQALGVGAWTWVVLQTIAGGTSDAEVASLLLWVYGWIGLAIVSALLGPAWAWLDPFTTLHDLIATAFRPLRLTLPGRAPWHPSAGAWPAVAAMVFFVWLELVGRFAGGRPLGLAMIGYTAVTLAGMAWYGKHRWRVHGEVFSVWFGLLGRLAPWGLAGRRRTGLVQRRGFGAALATEPWTASLLAVVAVGVASVIWDGIIGTRLYVELLGDPHPVIGTFLLLGFLGLVVGLVELVGRRVGRTAMGSGLVPVAVGYIVAHYLTFLLSEGQRIVAALSDPFQQGWDLIGTAAFVPREDLLPSSLVWTLQVGAVVLGHIVGAWLGHSAARRSGHEGAPVSQWPLAALMIGLTVVALWSLGQGLVFVPEATAGGS